MAGTKRKADKLEKKSSKSSKKDRKKSPKKDKKRDRSKSKSNRKAQKPLIASASIITPRTSLNELIKSSPPGLLPKVPPPQAPISLCLTVSQLATIKSCINLTI